MCPAVWGISDLGIFVMLPFRLGIGILVGAWCVLVPRLPGRKRLYFELC